MSKPIVGIDIDDVVANVIDSVRLWANEKTGANLTEAEYRTDDNYWEYYNTIWQRHGLSETVNFTMVLDDLAHDQSHIALVEGARETIHALKEKYDLVFITSRPAYQQDATRRWLDERIDSEIPMYTSHNPMANSDHRSKGEICAELGVKYLIDDNVGNCQNANEYGVEPLLFGLYGWNEKAPSNLRRFFTWDEVGEYLLHDVA